MSQCDPFFWELSRNCNQGDVFVLRRSVMKIIMYGVAITILQQAWSSRASFVIMTRSCWIWLYPSILRGDMSSPDPHTAVLYAAHISSRILAKRVMLSGVSQPVQPSDYRRMWCTRSIPRYSKKLGYLGTENRGLTVRLLFTKVLRYAVDFGGAAVSYDMRDQSINSTFKNTSDKSLWWEFDIRSNISDIPNTNPV